MLQFDGFKWESKEQEQGYGALVMWLREHGFDPDRISPADLFFIQKDYEATKWWRETFSTVLDQKRDEMMLLTHQVHELRNEVELLHSVLKSQQLLVEKLANKP